MSPMDLHSSGAANVENLENQLRLSLHPVKPDPNFVDHLNERLVLPVDTTLEYRQTAAISLLLIAFSLVSGILIIWAIRHLRTIWPRVN